ncbi:hypothetical protein GCM10028816_48820 [Spirosoma lituiforme]
MLINAILNHAWEVCCIFTKNNVDMGATRLIQKPENGQITFSVPAEMRDEPIII